MNRQTLTNLWSTLLLAIVFIFAMLLLHFFWINYSQWNYSFSQVITGIVIVWLIFFLIAQTYPNFFGVRTRVAFIVIYSLLFIIALYRGYNYKPAPESADNQNETSTVQTKHVDLPEVSLADVSGLRADSRAEETQSFYSDDTYMYQRWKLYYTNTIQKPFTTPAGKMLLDIFKVTEFTNAKGTKVTVYPATSIDKGIGEKLEAKDPAFIDLQPVIVEPGVTDCYMNLWVAVKKIGS